MSIYKFVTEDTSDLTNFVTFLNNIKNDTFLKDCTIDHTNDYIGSKLTISKNGVSIIISTTNDRSSAYDIIVYNGNKTFKSTANATSSNYRVYINSAIICKNGFIIKTPVKIGNATYDKYIVVTIDSNDNLSLVYYTGYFNSTSITGFDAVVNDSNDSNTILLTPRINGTVTSIGSVVPNSTTNVLIPFCYVSLTTQLPSYGLNTVTFGDDVFITNGYFYVKDM